MDDQNSWVFLQKAYGEKPIIKILQKTYLHIWLIKYLETYQYATDKSAGKQPPPH